ncbi:MAG: ChaN family lipoprotein [Desulfobulbaceae bacterium]|nr:ChaN family lipoprotein [Desulfobulbaceae bacterium]
MNFSPDELFQKLNAQSDYLDAIEGVVDQYAETILTADKNTLRMVALNLARIVAHHGIDGCEVPDLNQSKEREQLAMFYLAHHCHLFGEEVLDE